jgi:hypothetical protein
VTAEQIEREIERCDRELREMESQPPVQPAYLTTLGIEDWRREKHILERMRAIAQMPVDPRRPDKHRDPAGGWPIEEWGYLCARGFVSDSRFGANATVIKRTDRNVSRKWRRVGGQHAA